MMRLGLIFFLILLNAGPAPAGGNDKERYIRENRLLEEELKLARKQDIYLVFNLREKTVSLKARGLQLRKLPLKDFQYWGSPLGVKAYHLKRKSTLFEPGREVVSPGKTKNTDNFEIEALELADMPSKYAFVLDGGVRISIRPQAAGILLGIRNLLSWPIKFLTRPAAMFWNALRKKPYTAIDIVLDKNDAQTLYWSLADGSGVIVYPP